MGKDKQSYHLKNSTIKIFFPLLSLVSAIFLHQSNTQAFSLKITTPVTFDSSLSPGVGIAERRGNTFFIDEGRTTGEIIYSTSASLGFKIEFEPSDPVGIYGISVFLNPKLGSKSGRRVVIGFGSFDRSSSTIIESPELILDNYRLERVSDFFGVGSFTSSISILARVNNIDAGSVSESFLDETNFHVEKVPEPLTILGSATALGFGVLLKREYSKKPKN